MARKNQSERINAVVAIVSDLATITKNMLEIYFPGSEPAQERVQELQLMLSTLVDNQAGYPQHQLEEVSNDLPK